MSDPGYRFVTKKNAPVDDTPRGPHEWLCRPDVTESEMLTVVRVEMPVGAAHPFHYHPPMEEALYFLSGRAEQWVEEQSRLLGPGEVAHIPKGVVHGTYNVGDEPLVFLAILSPAQFEGPAVIDCSHDKPWCELKPPMDQYVMESERAGQ
jgi:quercetin dioxygenase-like cupin family protein